MMRASSLVVIVAALLLAAPVPAAGAAAGKPNIVLIFIDDMGYGDIGPFGNTIHRTPNLDKLAAEGIKFTSFYGGPVCSMSRAALLTGCYNTRVSVPGVLFPNDDIGLHPNEITIADLLRSQGYATACIGKWHLGHFEPLLPTNQGFDSYFGIPYSNDMTLDTGRAVFARDCVFRMGMNPQKARAEAIKGEVPLMRGTEVVEYPTDQKLFTQRLTEEAITFIGRHKDQPFFVYMPHVMVHKPLAASAKFEGKGKDGTLLGDAIEELDWSLGEIMKTLADLKLDDKTLVIFLSDNGAAVGSSLPLRGKKASVFEGGVRVPCIMRWPGKIPAGTSCNQIAGNIDMLPTFAALSGAPVPTDRVIDGRDITSLMFQKNAPAVRDTQLIYDPPGNLTAIRQGDWKLVTLRKNPQARANRQGPGKDALFNLAADLSEENDVAAQHPEVVAKLKAEMAARDAEIKRNRRPAGSGGGGSKPAGKRSRKGSGT
jgi:arylsulfatase A